MVETTRQAAERSVAGWREWIHLPELGLGPLVAKLDTGARTSALHAEEMAFFERDGLRHVRFRVPLVGRRPCALAQAEGCRNCRIRGWNYSAGRVTLVRGHRNWPQGIQDQEYLRVSYA